MGDALGDRQGMPSLKSWRAASHSLASLAAIIASTGQVENTGQFPTI